MLNRTRRHRRREAGDQNSHGVRRWWRRATGIDRALRSREPTPLVAIRASRARWAQAQIRSRRLALDRRATVAGFAILRRCRVSDLFR